MANELKLRQSPTKAAIYDLAMDIGKQVVEHIELMHQDMVKGSRSWKSARLSIRNATANAVLAAVDAADKGRDRQALESNAKHRRTMRRLRKSAGMAV